ncbi:MAG: chitobiase/beta-hexosaminidase C-terminal domain-containing protein [Candidatus Cloacimonetes bacterium]|jgi:hypothetical protein|nr:chitobiase/beta-hexosaminidase C-terminal domain-containing protein [Candidatus Cloacimonadota bacterium]MDD4677488.1 chitobiase/beta-hexosaminidase C-terminal domain-containing protein [Candidatus Cloacimonadota bacterium]
MKHKIIILLFFVLYSAVVFAIDPWSEPVILTGSMTVMATVSISGFPATEDDVLAAFAYVNGIQELRGKSSISVVNEIPGCLLQIYTEINGEIIFFKVWDESAQQILAASPNVTSEINGIIGSFPNNLFPIYASITQIVSDPTFSPEGGSYQTAQDVTIICATSGAEIHYTLNGTGPNEYSTLYSAPLHIATNTLVKAKAYQIGWDPSSTTSAYYEISDANYDEINSSPTEILYVYPNPFTSSTTIELNLKDESGYYTLDIYNIKGERVHSISGLGKGSITQVWDGKDEQGNKLSAGIYLLCFRTSSFSYTNKLMLK